MDFGPWRVRDARFQACPQPDDLVLTRQGGDATQRKRGVDHRQARRLGAPLTHNLRGDLLGIADHLFQLSKAEWPGITPTDVAARDHAGSRRAVEGEDELL